MAADSRQPYPNHNYVPEYQISALPYNTTSQSTSQIVVKTATGEVVEGANPAAPGADETTIAQIEFPKITQWLQFKGASQEVRVYFSRKDAAAGNLNCIQVDAGEKTFPLNIEGITGIVNILRFLDEKNKFFLAFDLKIIPVNI